jgi:hypothetical protein
MLKVKATLISLMGTESNGVTIHFTLCQHRVTSNDTAIGWAAVKAHA